MLNQIPSHRRLLARLNLDLAELQGYPYPGVHVFIEEANFREFCFVLTPSSGPWSGLALNFAVTLPENRPGSPPSIKATSHIDHPNIAQENLICCDLLISPKHSVKCYTGGYSPALTLRVLFIQFLAFLSSTKIEYQYGGGENIIGDHLPAYYLRVENNANYWPPSGDPRPWYYLEDQDDLRVVWDSALSRSNGDVEEVVIREYIVPVSQEKVTETVQRISNQDLPIQVCEWVNPLWMPTYRTISSWICDKCQYGSPSLPHHQTTTNQPIINTIATPKVLSMPPLQC